MAKIFLNKVEKEIKDICEKKLPTAFKNYAGKSTDEDKILKYINRLEVLLMDSNIIEASKRVLTEGTPQLTENDLVKEDINRVLDEISINTKLKNKIRDSTKIKSKLVPKSYDEMVNITINFYNSSYLSIKEKKGKGKKESKKKWKIVKKLFHVTGLIMSLLYNFDKPQYYFASSTFAFSQVIMLIPD